jgi:hypothetical protein
MAQIGFSPVPILSLLDRAIQALVRADAVSTGEVLSDCDRVGVPTSQEEFSRALAQKEIFAKLLEQTSANLRVLRGSKDGFRYGRGRGDK